MRDPLIQQFINDRVAGTVQFAADSLGCDRSQVSVDIVSYDNDYCLHISHYTEERQTCHGVDVLLKPANLTSPADEFNERFLAPALAALTDHEATQ